jgi:hypothetical protein
VDTRLNHCTDQGNCGLLTRQIDVRGMHAQAKDRFERVGIAVCHLDRAVLEFLIAATTRSIENPLGYCLAVGRRLQDEAERRAGRVQSAQRWWIENACPHGAVDVEICPRCAEDRQRALELFPSLRRFLSNSTDSAGLKRGRT